MPKRSRNSRWALLPLLSLLFLLCAVFLAESPVRADARGSDASEAGSVSIQVAADAPPAEGVGDQVKRAARLARERASEERFRRLTLVRGGIALSGFVVFGWGAWLARRGRPDAAYSLRVGLLSLLAVTAFASYYGFFNANHPGGFKGGDVFHYYMGSKYFDVIGYFELYHCTLAALVEEGLQDPGDIPEVRDQHSLRLQSAAATLEGMRQCPGRFEPSRWEEFKADAAFFRPRILGGSWTHLLMDHGYNPTPVWSFVGGLFSKSVPTTSESFHALITIDRILAIAMAVLIAWAFGVEAACLVAVVWGTSPLWSYDWTGDSFLRNLWLFAAVAGLCLLERGRHVSSGALLAASALLRLFPGIFLVGFFAHVLHGWRRDGIPAQARRFAIGAAVASAILLLGGAFGTGRGPAAYLEFREKMSEVVEQPGNNKVGLSAAATNLIYRAATREVTISTGETARLPEPAPFATGAVRFAQFLLAAAGLFAFWRALHRVTSAEATVLGFALIPLLTSPANYYYPFVIFAAMLAPRRPWTGVALCIATLAWIAMDQTFFLEEGRFRAYDVVAICFSLVFLFGMALSRPQPQALSRPQALAQKTAVSTTV